MIDSIKTDEQISDEENAKKVSDKIASIGIVTFDSENTILNIRMEYNALSDGSKNLVSNYEILVKAEQRLEELKKQSNSNGSDNGISDNTDNQNPNDNSTNAPKTGINLSIEFCLIFMILSFGGFVAVKKAKEAQEN